MKKITQCLVALMLLFGGTLSTFAYDFAAGTGTATDPYQIATKADLVGVGDYFNDAANPTATGKHYLQTADIDLDGDLWKSMGDDSSAKSFRGHFDGGNFKISNMIVDGLSGETTTTVYYFGLFEAIGPGAVIENVHIDGGFVIISTDGGARVGSAYAGGIAGYAAGTNAAGEIIIRNCSNSATITNEALNSSYTGGIVGHASLGAADYTTSLIVSYCANTGDINGNLSRGGGIVGSAQSNVNGEITISNCYNNAEISSTRTSGDAFIGGIAGTPYLGTATSGPVTINKCFAAGRLDDNSADASRTGGIAGRLYGRAGADDKITIKNNVAAQDEIVTAYASAGRVWSSTTASTTYVTTNNYGYKGMILKGATVTGTDPNTKNGLDKTLAELQTAATYAELGWDLANVWEITAGDFPTLRPNALEVEIPTPYTVTFTVKDAENTPITDAVIKYNYITNAAGNYVFASPVGEFAYEVKKADYATASGTITVTDANVTKDVTLQIEIGTATNPYLISTAAEFDAIRTTASATKTYYKLTADIDLTSVITDAEKGWAPINSSGTGWQIDLDGQNHIISGLWANRPDETLVSLFGRLSTSTIKNLGVVAGDIVGGSMVGTLVGFSSNNLTVEKVFATGNVKGTNRVGGLFGTLRGTATDVYFRGNVEGTYRVAGIGNHVAAEGSGSLIRGYAQGTVKADSIVGGLFGEAGTNTGTVRLFTSTDSHAATQVTATGIDAGALIGRTNATNTLTLTGVNTYNTTLNATLPVIGNGVTPGGEGTVTGKTTAEQQVQANYANWDFATTWKIDEGGYPRFQWEEVSDVSITSPKANTLKASASNGALTVIGLTAGESVRVYTVVGQTVANVTATGTKTTIHLPTSGIYIVSAGNQAVKVVVGK